MRRVAAPLLGAAAAAALVACAPPAGGAPANPQAKDANMSDELDIGSFDRPPPPAVPPVERDGLRYAQHIGTHGDVADQSGGLLDVVDVASGKRLATIKVYDNRRDGMVEGDVQDIFFASMAFDATGRLIVTDEIGRRFAVDVKARHSTPMP